MPYQRDLLPSFAGINAFARAPRADLSEVTEGCVAVIGVPHDSTSVSRQGARLGPRAIREASADFIYDLQASESGALIDVISGRVLNTPKPGSILDLGDVSVSPIERIEALDACMDAAEGIARAGGFPVALGGDGFITFPLLHGLGKARGGDIGFIRLTGQLSLSDRSGAWTGATLSRILSGTNVNARNAVCVGVQGYIPYKEWEFARDKGVTVITADSVKEQGPEAAARRALELASDGCDAVYVSLDIGVVDSGYASGTPDIVVGGLTPRDLLSLVRELSTSPKIAAMDVVEVAPGLDVRGRSERLAAQAIIELIAPRVFGS